MRKLLVFISLIVLMLSQINMFAQAEVQDTNQYAIKAIKQAVIQYHQQKSVGYYKYMMFTLKITEISKISGEFVISYIDNGYEYNRLKPTHYIYVNNELVLIIVDNTCKTDPADYGINKITKKTKEEALKILAGPNLIIGGEAHSHMVFNYEKSDLKGKFYSRFDRMPDNYWF